MFGIVISVIHIVREALLSGKEGPWNMFLLLLADCHWLLGLSAIILSHEHGS